MPTLKSEALPVVPVQRKRKRGEDRPNPSLVLFHGYQKQDVEMMRRALTNGADPNQKIKLFGHHVPLVSRCCTYQCWRRGKTDPAATLRFYASALRLFVEFGADLDTQYTFVNGRQQHYWSSREQILFCAYNFVDISGRAITQGQKFVYIGSVIHIIASQ